MTTTLTDGTATGVDVYVGQSSRQLGGILIGAGLVGLLLALGDRRPLDAAPARARRGRRADRRGCRGRHDRMPSAPMPSPPSRRSRPQRSTHPSPRADTPRSRRESRTPCGFGVSRPLPQLSGRRSALRLTNAPSPPSSAGAAAPPRSCEQRGIGVGIGRLAPAAEVHEERGSRRGKIRIPRERGVGGDGVDRGEPGGGPVAHAHGDRAVERDDGALPGLREQPVEVGDPRPVGVAPRRRLRVHGGDRRRDRIAVHRPADAVASEGDPLVDERPIPPRAILVREQFVAVLSRRASIRSIRASRPATERSAGSRPCSRRVSAMASSTRSARTTASPEGGACPTVKTR